MARKANSNEKRYRDLEGNIKKIDGLIQKLEMEFLLAHDPIVREKYQKDLKQLKAQRAKAQREYASFSSSQVEIEPVAKITSFSEKWLGRLPYPLAAPCKDFNQASDATARFLALDHTLANIVKYLAAVM